MADDKDTSAAVAVRQRRIAATKVVETPPPPASLSPLGVVSDSPQKPAALVGSFVAGHTSSEEYVRASNPAYHTWYPRGCFQPSTVLLWNRGQLVHRAHFEANGGDNAPSTPATALPVNEPGGGLPGHVSGIPVKS